jgi:RNA recognition motif-containing protein
MQSDSRTLLTSNASASSSSTAGKPDRLYVGNLSPSVDEYTLIQVFQKYGQITKLDFMFHKTGVLKGKPRGYAFVEFSSKDVSRLQTSGGEGQELMIGRVESYG